jgi:hypothetical protein
MESAGVSQDEFHHHFDVDLELHRERHPGLGEDGRFPAAGLGYEALSYALLVGTAAFTTWYPGHVSRVRHVSPP